jgi:hypothetical protein
MKIVEQLKTMPIAIATDEANDQHYEGVKSRFSWLSGCLLFDHNIVFLTLFI